MMDGFFLASLELIKKSLSMCMNIFYRFSSNNIISSFLYVFAIYTLFRFILRPFLGHAVSDVVSSRYNVRNNKDDVELSEFSNYLDSGKG